MTTYISPYTPALVLPQYKTTNYDPTLEIALLEKKQKDFDTFLSRINNLKSQAINMTMLNEKGMEKLKNYNEELDQLLSGDPGDLSDVRVQSKIAGYFSKVAGDADLKLRNKYSDHYLSQNKLIENMKLSKDEKVRNQYNAINEFVYKNDDGGLYDFAKADDITDWNSKMVGYTPFKDIDQKMVNITKLLKEETKITQAPYTTVGPDGKVVNSPYFRYSETKGVSARRIQALMSSMLDADEMAQFDVMTKYRILSSDNESLFNTYDTFMSTNRAKTEGLLNNVVSQKEVFNPAKLPSDATAEKRAEYTKLFGELQEQEEFYKKKLEYFDVNKVDKDAFTKLDNKGKFGLMRNITIESYIEGVSNALKVESSTEKFVVDPTYFQSLNYNLNVQREANNQWYREQTLRLKEMSIQMDAAKAAGKAAEGSAVVPGVYFSDDQKLIPTLEEFDKQYDAYNKALQPLITTGKPEDYNSNEWLTKNKDNFEVKLWAHYKSTNQNPTVEGFKTFLTAVENGDYSGSPVVESIYKEFQNAQDLRNFYDKERGELSKRIAELAKIENVTAPGGSNTLASYAQGRSRKNGELVIGVPTDPNKTNYKDMTWGEVRKEFLSQIQEGLTKQKIIIEGLENYNVTPTLFNSLGVLGKIADWLTKKTLPEMHWYEGILRNDSGLFETVKAAFIKEQAAMKDIDKKLSEVMIGYSQHEQVKLTGEKITTQHTGAIQESFRTHAVVPKTWTSDALNKPILIENNDIESVILPTVGNVGGYTLTAKGAKNFNETFPELKLTDVNGVAQSVTPNVIYKFNTTPIQNQNTQLDIMFRRTGEVKRKIYGYDVSIVRNPTEPNMAYISIPKVSATVNTIPVTNITDMMALAEQIVKSHKASIINTQPK